MSTLAVNTIQAETGSTVTVASGHSLDASNGLTTPAGHIIQTVHSVMTSGRVTVNNGSSFVATGHSISITPKSANSTLHIFLSVVTNSGNNNYRLQIYETTSSPASIQGSDIYTGDHSGWRTVNYVQQIDSTGTSQRTFETYGKSTNAIYGIGTTTRTAPQHNGATITIMEIAQ